VTGRDRIVILVVLAVAAVVGSWLFVVSPKRGQASSLGTQITAEQGQLTSAQGEVAAGEAAQKEFSGQYAQLASLGEAVPPDDDVPSLIYQLQGAAKAAGVDFRSLQLTGGGSSSSSSSSTSSTGAAAAAAALPPGAAVGAAGLPIEQFAFTLEGNFFQLANFFKGVQDFVTASGSHISISGRLMTINAISLTPASTGSQLTASVSATTYIVPATQGPVDGATPSGPAGTTQSDQASTSSSSSAAPAAAVTAPVVR
jgi:Tfp pilus assembly protein PilO